MAGSRWPFPSVTGRPQLLRASLYGRLDLVAGVGVQVGVVNAQWDALGKGLDVTFTREQILSWYPRGNEQHPDLPSVSELNAHAFWTLTGDTTLVGSDA